MNGKTPISALQELMAAKKLPLPIYIEESYGASFKCTVHAAGVTAVGISSTKKSAKHESAKNALEKLGTMTKPQQIVVLTLPTSPPENKPFKNFVGELNEYSSKFCFKYPDYEFVTIGRNGEFYFKCWFLGKEVLGNGKNKKDAKQDSAKKMLELVRSIDLITINETYKKIEDIALRPKIISMYEALTVKDPTVSSTKNDYAKAIPETDIFEHDNVDVLRAKLRQYGINYTLSELQNRPFIMCARISGTDLYFIQSDDSREEATRKVLQDVLEASKSGCSLNTNDLISFK